MTIAAHLRALCAALQPVCPDDRQAQARLMLSHIVGLPPTQLLLHPDDEVTLAQERALADILAMRLSRVPWQYITGEAPFYGRMFRVTPDVLIPRMETEHLAERAIAAARARTGARVLDLCTGSGCLGITVALEVPDAVVFASDISEQALSIAQENAKALCADVTFLRGDMLDAVGDRVFDLIVCNPPYVESEVCSALSPEVRREPRKALDGGADGLAFYRTLKKDAPARLSPNGDLLMEIGDTQGAAVRDLLHGAFTQCAVEQDYTGRDRMVLCTGRLPVAI